MSIKLKIDPVLSHYTNNQQSVQVSGNTVGECLGNLAKQFPDLKTVMYNEEGILDPTIFFYINGKFVGQELNKPVKDGDELYIIVEDEFYAGGEDG